VPAVWVVDLHANVVESFAEPGPSGYARRHRAEPGEVLTLPALPDMLVPVAELVA
jgi:hypothetical protein